MVSEPQKDFPAEVEVGTEEGGKRGGTQGEEGGVSEEILEEVNEMVSEMGGQGLTQLEAQLLYTEVLAEGAGDGEGDREGDRELEWEDFSKEDEGWYFVEGERVVGPVGWAALQGAVAHGSVGEDSWVFHSSMADWITAAELPGLLPPPELLPPPPPKHAPPALGRGWDENLNSSNVNKGSESKAKRAESSRSKRSESSHVSEPSSRGERGERGASLPSGRLGSPSGSSARLAESPMVSTRRRTRGRSNIERRSHRFSARYEAALETIYNSWYLAILISGDLDTRRS